MLGLSKATVLRWAASGKLTKVQQLGNTRYAAVILDRARVEKVAAALAELRDAKASA